MTDVMAPPNERAVMGGNQPPEPTSIERLSERVREYVATGSAWVNEIQEITSQAQADAAGAYVKQGAALIADGEKERKAITDPMYALWKKTKAQYDKVIDPAGKARTLVQAKVTAWFEKEDARLKREAAEAAAAAAKAEADAIAAAEKAFDLHDKAQSGELAGSGVNTVQAMADAEAAQAVADQAAADAERAASKKVGAAGQYTVDGKRRTMGLRERTTLVLDVPEQCPKAIRSVALSKLAQHIVMHGTPAQVHALQQEIGRIVNAMYRDTGEIAPHTREHTERKAV